MRQLTRTDSVLYLWGGVRRRGGERLLRANQNCQKAEGLKEERTWGGKREYFFPGKGESEERGEGKENPKRSSKRRSVNFGGKHDHSGKQCSRGGGTMSGVCSARKRLADSEEKMEHIPQKKAASREKNSCDSKGGIEKSEEYI